MIYEVCNKARDAATSALNLPGLALSSVDTRWNRPKGKPGCSKMEFKLLNKF